MGLRWAEKQVTRCVQDPVVPYFTEQQGIAFCSRCGFARGLHDTVRERLRQQRKVGEA